MFFETYSKEVVSAVVPFLVWLLTYLTKAKTKIQYATPHEFTFLINEPLKDADNIVIKQKQTVHTITQIVTNVGTQTATKLEVVFNYRPLYLNIWPARHYVEHTETDDRYVLVFESLAPREQIQFHVFTLNGSSPTMLAVRSDQCAGKAVNMVMYPVVSQLRIRLLQGLAFVGMGTAVYLLLVLLQFVVLHSPAVH